MYASTICAAPIGCLSFRIGTKYLRVEEKITSLLKSLKTHWEKYAPPISGVRYSVDLTASPEGVGKIF